MVRSTIKASEVLQHDLDRYVEQGKITVHLDTNTDEIVATDGKITSVKATKAGVPTVFETDGVFVFVGLKPNTQFIAGSGIELDELGLIKTDSRMQTNVPGIFASGDVRSGATTQIASAVGEGATAALSIREYLDEQSRA